MLGLILWVAKAPSMYDPRGLVARIIGSQYLNMQLYDTQLELVLEDQLGLMRGSSNEGVLQ